MAQNDNILLTGFFDLLFAAAASTGFTEAYGMEEKKLGLVLSDWVCARSVLPRGPCFFSMGQLTKTPWARERVHAAIGCQASSMVRMLAKPF